MQEIVVVKFGGGEGISLEEAADAGAALVRSGVRTVIVHGGSHDTNTLCERLGVPVRTIISPSGHQSRRTDGGTLDVFKMAYCGRINKTLVELLHRRGINAVGLSGIDGGLWTARRKDAIRSVEDGRTVIVRDDLSGRVIGVDHELLNLLLDSGRVPVLTPPAITRDGIAVNVDADRAAAATAGALGAGELLLLSNVRGVCADPDDPGSVIEDAGADLGLVRRAARGRMKNKVLAAEEAFDAGVGRVTIASARGADAIERARAGAGTTFHGVPA